MKKIETQIQIETSVENVWSIFSDFTQYHEWNPFLREVQGALKEGECLKIKVALSNGKVKFAEPKIEKITRGKEIWFLTKKRFLFTGKHYFIFEAISPSKTRVIHGEIFSGILPFFLWHRIKKVFSASFEEMNKALKLRAEKHK
jgi:hypothetical protein